MQTLLLYYWLAAEVSSIGKLANTLYLYTGIC